MNKKSPNFFASAKKTFAQEVSSLAKIPNQIDRNKFNEICELIINCKGNIVLMGIGKSGNIAAKISSTFSSTGTPSFYLNAAEASHGDLGSLKKNDILVIFSFSGETEEIVQIFPTCKSKVRTIVSITGNEESSIAKYSNLNLHLEISEEACPLNLAPTTSSSAMLILGDALAIAILEARKFSPEDFAKNHPGGKLGKSLLKVKDLMISGNSLPLISDSAPMKDVIYEISNKGLGLTLVKDNKRKIIGLFTDGDLRRLLNKNSNIEDLKINALMTRKFQAINKNMQIKNAIDQMNKYKIYSLVVKGEKGRVEGIIRMHDIIEAKII
ncbi:KpsF/GutQ family sugar-phosphate isomerase [SAR86 cluster bacterium]|nr:KpsF/GutQ family sugar-phosphate isomerase [SAR86 cluster bacterium]